MTSEFAVEAKGLCKSFGDNKVLRSIEFSAHSSCLTALIGPSGSGKSTLLRCFNLLEFPDQGEMYHAGKQVHYSKMKESEIALHRRQMGMVFQDFQLFPHKTVLENVSMAPRLHGLGSTEEIGERARQLLAKVGMLEKAEASPASLSGGQKQRVAIARSLAMEPEILLLDEPTSALDIELISGINDLLCDLREQGLTMILVTHDLSFAYQVAQKLVFMDEGEVIEQGNAHDVLNNPQSERLKKFLKDCQFQ